MPQPNPIQQSNLPGITIGDDPTTGGPDAPSPITAPLAGDDSGALGTSVSAPPITIPLILDSALATDPVLELGVIGEAMQRLVFDADGFLKWSTGTQLDAILVPRDSSSPNTLGLYPGTAAGGSSTGIDLYNGAFHGTQPNPVASTPAASWIEISSAPASSIIQLADFIGVGGVSITGRGATATPNSMYGVLELQRDTAAPAASGLSAVTISDATAGVDPVFAIGYDGSQHWSTGAAASDVELVHDTTNIGPGAVGVYPAGAATAAQISVYDNGLLPDGTATGFPLYGEVIPGAVIANSWSTSAIGKLQLNPESPGVFYPIVVLAADALATPAADHGLELSHNTNLVASWNYDGSINWANGAGGATDTTLERAAAGVLQIPQHGGGIKLTSPDGSQTKQIQLSNAGALVVV